MPVSVMRLLLFTSLTSSFSSCRFQNDEWTLAGDLLTKVSFPSPRNKVSVTSLVFSVCFSPSAVLHNLLASCFIGLRCFLTDSCYRATSAILIFFNEHFVCGRFISLVLQMTVFLCFMTPKETAGVRVEHCNTATMIALLSSLLLNVLIRN
jgi:hypothetical protein